MVRKLAVTALGVVHGLLGDPAPRTEEKTVVLSLQGRLRLVTVITPYDASRHADTYKVFTHLYGAQGNTQITKGVGGFDSHQRGLYIGWRKTSIGATTLDSWHMKGCSQRALPDAISEFSSTCGQMGHTVGVAWCNGAGEPFLKETRRLTVLPDSDGIHWSDIRSTLACVREPVRLQGDPHHGGLHIRLANEVCRHPWSTRFTIPRTANWAYDDCILGAWWVLGRCVVQMRTYWLVFMTRPTLKSPPVHSARAYGKLGAFVETVVTPDNPFHLQCRLGLSEHELTEETCEHVFRAMEWGD